MSAPPIDGDRNGARDRRRQARALAWILVALAPQTFAAGWGGSLGAASDYVFRGLSQSEDQPSAQADVHYYAASGWFAGLSAATVRIATEGGTTAELEAYAGISRPLGENWSARLDLVHYSYPGYAPARRYNYDELIGSIDYRDRVFVSVAASPDTSIESTRGSPTTRPALAYDVALHQPLFRALSANAGVGYEDLRWLVHTGYVYWNAGLAYDFGAVQLDVSYIGTSGKAKTLFYRDVADDRVVAALLWHF